MQCECKDWVTTQIDYNGLDWEGEPIDFPVPAEVCPLCGDTRIDADKLLIHEQKKIGEIFNLTPQEMEIMWFLYALGPKYTKRGYIEQKYRFNKMLFYLWMRLVESGFGDTLIHDAFDCEERGPVPINLLGNSKSLEAKGLVKMQYGGRKAKQPYRWDLTPRGTKVAKALWDKTPDIYKNKVTEVKRDLFLIDTTELMHKVHSEYPEYRKVYDKEDKE